jgi:phenylalanyl-tRNA synthetase beta chain
MKFSYSLLKKFVPGITSKKKLIEELNMKAFETEGSKGDVLDIKVLNRYSSASSHWGMAREISAIFGLKTAIPDKRLVNIPEGLGKVKINESDLCPRYCARYFEITKVGSSPAWMQKALKSCGMRPINAVVDIMNYAMLETGQPLHAFDADKSGSSIVVRRAHNGEKFTTLDDDTYTLTENMLLITDGANPLALAGIKGGKSAEVGNKTRRILIEAANFDGASIYRTSRRLGLVTDASARFTQGLTPHLVKIGMDRATVLLSDILKAKLVDSGDVHKKLPGLEIIEFSVGRFNRLIGLNLPAAQIINYLKRLDFTIKKGKSADKFLVEIPPLRDDITIFEDLAEEVGRLYGYNNLPASPPVVGLNSAEVDDAVQLKREARMILSGLGFNEVYNYSFNNRRSAASRFLPVADDRRLEIENPISEDKKFLRSELITGLVSNIETNERLFGDLDFFEIGKVWAPKEELHLGMVIRRRGTQPFLELKGAVQALLERLGIPDLMLRSDGKSILVECDHKVVGFISAHHGKTAFAELNLDSLVTLASGENEFKPLSKYPAIIRDLSLTVKRGALVGDILEAINASGADDIENVDLADYYDPTRFTFRIIFRSSDRTLTDGEANSELNQIIKHLRANFDLGVR